MANLKQQVSEFYNQVGWQEVSEGEYQNARYEDLRPVSGEYIHRCHLRVLRHLKPAGKFLLDAGSGPVQYPEYIEYSKGYQRRVCADISSVALQEARRRIGGHGLFVVCDIANMPFAANAFDGVVSLHTIHHLPADEHPRAYAELHRVLAPQSSAVVVNGWDAAPLANAANWLVGIAGKLRVSNGRPPTDDGGQRSAVGGQPSGTFIRKHNAAWLQHEIGAKMPLTVWVWRTFSVNFLRTFIHSKLGGRWLLKLLFWLEERFPHWLGKNGQYPIIVIEKRET